MVTKKIKTEYLVLLHCKDFYGEAYRSFLHDGKHVKFYTSATTAEQDATIHCQQFKSLKHEIVSILRVN